MSESHFTIEQDGPTIVARVHLAELTILEADELVNELRHYLEKVGGRHFVIDMASVSYIDSAVIGSLVTFLIEVDKHDGRLALADCQPTVSTLMKVTGLDTHIILSDTVATAAVDMEQRDAA